MSSVLEINLSDLDHNIGVLRTIIGPECELCPIVKADAYGLGAARIAKRMVQSGVKMLAVYTPEQAVELFRSAAGCTVLVLMPVREISRADELYRGLISDRLHLTVHDYDHVDDLIAITEQYGVTIPVHLEVDTGMSRGGCNVREAGAALRKIAACRRLHLAGVFTHFASSESNEEFTSRQMAAFDDFLMENADFVGKSVGGSGGGCRVHVASSFAVLRHKRYHKMMVRIGLAWAGYGLEWMHNGAIIEQARELRPILSWRSEIVQIKEIERGTPVGYGSTWTSRRRSVIGLVPVGYADGYPIAAGGGGSRGGRGVETFAPGASVSVLIDDDNHESIGYAPVVGSVNMDQIVVDLTDVAEGAASRGLQIGVGTRVELISARADAPNHLPNLARMAGTIPHEMMCRLNPRLKRLYTAPVEVITTPSAKPQAVRQARALVG